MGKEILIKAKQQINNLEEKVIVREPPEAGGAVEVQVDTSDQANITFSPKSDVNPPKKESSDTVYGQGTAPKPEDETYLSLLKGTTVAKAKVKIKEEDEEDEEDDKDKIEVRIDGDGRQASADLNPSYVAGPKPK